MEDDDSLEEALRSAVSALKGAKAVGSLLWPEMKPELAGKRLNQCLDHERPEKLELSQLMLIARKARAVECHSVMDYLARELNYTYEAITPESAIARMEREFLVTGHRNLEVMQEMLKKVEAFYEARKTFSSRVTEMRERRKEMSENLEKLRRHNVA